MQSRLQHLKRQVLRGGEVAQGLFMLMTAFLVLLGFVGLVADVALMLVRFNSLQRAVNLAAIDTANRIRANPSLASNTASLVLEARRSIQFYGLETEQVQVQTCLTAPNDLDWCGKQHKRVQVSANTQSSTVLLRLLGWPTITVNAKAVSETAVLDLVIILDASESMLADTNYEDWEQVGQGRRYMPPHMDAIYYDSGNGFKATMTHAEFWQWTLRSSQNELDANGVYEPVSWELSQEEPRPACRVRFWPGAASGGAAPRDAWLAEYEREFGFPYPYATWDGFVPTYDFYACCNDPGTGYTVDTAGNISGGTGTSPDFDFSELICQPFKQARDAARLLLQRVDFMRGDRVAFVTFDRQAHRVDPDGVGPQTFMIGDLATAVNTLNRLVGVRAEPSFYGDVNNDGRWDRLVADGVLVDSTAPQHYWNTTPLGDLHDYPVRDSCPFLNATLPPYYTLLRNYPGYPDPLLQSVMLPSWAASPTYSYDLWASCRGSNIGAALREASDALNFPTTTRTDNSLWVMVMFSDGASGASDPVRRGNAVLIPSDPYYEEVPGSGRYQPVQGQYGALGVCPYGQVTEQNGFPYCADEDSATRHFCGSDPSNLDLNAETGCQPTSPNPYDVDDYARDWGDYIALLEHPARPVLRGDVHLPAIFTIGLGLDFEQSDGSCAANPRDCLGEELLRYFADVGDNNQLDSDYQQDWLDQGQLGEREPPEGWGPRDPCELPIGDGIVSGMYAPLPSRRSCGNYYNAPGEQELIHLFQEIVVRMETRILDPSETAR